MQPAVSHARSLEEDPLAALGGGRWTADAAMTRLHSISPGLVGLLGFSEERWRDDAGLWYERLHPSDREAVLGARSERRDHVADYRLLASDGRVVWLREAVRFTGDGIESVVLDVTGEKRAHDTLAWQRSLVRAISAEAPLPQTLDILCREAAARGEPGRHHSIMLATPDGKRLRHAAAPSLPESFTRLLQDAPVAAEAPSCIAAAATRARVANDDIAGDARWAGWRAPALAAGLRSSWSIPILSPAGGILGTWTTYATRPGAPSLQDEEIVAAAAQLVPMVIERARWADTLREGDERFRLLARATNDCVWDWDLRANALWWNENLRTMFGYEPAEVEPDIRSWTARIAPEDAARVEASIHRAIESGAATWQDEYRFRRKDGSYADILDRGFIIRDGAGRAVRMVGSMMDVTDRRAAAAELERVKHHFELILESAGEGVYGVDHEGTTTFMNAAALRMLGLEAKDAIGRKLHDVIHHSRADGRRYPAVECPIYQAAHGGPGAAVKDEVFFRTDGTPFSVEYVTSPIRDQGRVVGAVTVFSDVTERRRAERELRESRERLDLALGAAALGAWDLDLATDTSVRSFRHDEIFGYAEPQAEWGATRFFEHVLPEHREAVRAAFDEAFRVGRLSFECEIARADGARAWIAAQGVVLYEDAKPVRMLGVVGDITQRRHAQAEIKRSGERTAAILESISDAFFALDRDWRFTYVNQQAERVLSRRKEDLLGRTLWEEYPGVQGTAFEAAYRRALAEGASTELEDYYPDHDAWYAVKAYPSAEGLSVFFQNVTERKRAERELRESEARYRFLADNARDMITRSSPDGRLLYVSPAARRLLGYEPEELVGRVAMELVHPEDVERVRREREQIAAQDDARAVTLRFRRKDGSYVWLEAIAQAVHDPKTGALVEFVGASRDVTDRKLAERALEERAAQLAQLTAELQYQSSLMETITNNAGSALFLMDERGHPVVMNQAACAMTGYASVEEIRSRPLHDSVHFRKPDGSPYPMEECPIDRASAQIVPLKDQREVFCRKDGTLFPVEYNLAPIERGGARRGAVLEVRDITRRLAGEQELKARAEELARLTDQLARSNRELDQFAYITSHDLKAPLRGIANLSRWIEEDLEGHITPESREHLELLRGRVNRMEALIDAILEY
ncbi:MAG TPA: PAS domain S-box protein, partial [Candidatus Thermoplasmatota archaeon]|nr:PAS domain S-box protein [Candidatus Thermoplasmatota archaeon]